MRKDIKAMDCHTISITDFRDASDRTLFMSSEVTDLHPYVHHFYIRNKKLNYLIYNPVDDVVMEHYVGEQLDHSLIEYERSAFLNVFDLEAFSLVENVTLANTAYYSPPEHLENRFHTKVMEDVTLRMNQEQQLSAGYLIDSHNLANTVIGIKIKNILTFVTECLSDIINEAFEHNDSETAVLGCKYMEVVDTISLSIVNSQPVSLNTINEFKQLLFKDNILVRLVSYRKFTLLECPKHFDLMLGKCEFTSSPKFLMLERSLSEFTQDI